MRIVFMGTPDFSVPTLEALVASEHEVVGVVTQPDKPKGRGKEIHMSPVKECALQHNIPVYQPVRARDEAFVDEMRALNPDVMVVIAFGQILPKSLLELPKYGCVNIHASLLPKYRGAAPIQWAVINGDEETGITTMMMDVEMDTGDILEKTVVKLDPEETGGSLFDRLSLLGGDLILSTLSKLEKGEITPVPQDHEKATYVKKISKSMGDIDWTMDAVSIERLVRGLNPWPSAFTRWNGKMLKIWEAKVLPDPDVKLPCGSVISASDEGLKIQTGAGVLCVTSLQLEGKKRMDTAAFLRGYQVAAGSMMERSE
ncbi:methionyl-tRNA formyltransferase [Clostridium sp. AM42-4]|jgi:methionyl-tRNA formyltransferase|uniref:methionyl-tRNA formyltransferase n=1 Tax=Clostridium sp. AM42-4 TaxID=2292305 RepID=UPI000E530830|nr:methionyl-tRNA formyltransferase [Clostridium sp. AM42-4]RHS85888.1 methionyl-tRNA formyltransferase [Clostridium sp. AM42-4]